MYNLNYELKLSNSMADMEFLYKNNPAFCIWLEYADKIKMLFFSNPEIVFSLIIFQIQNHQSLNFFQQMVSCSTLPDKISSLSYY